MRIKAVFLDNVNNINSFEIKEQLELFEGQIGSVYLMLQNENGLRYIPQGTANSLSVQFPSLDNAQVIELTATQPFADDKSIFKVDIPSSSLPKTGAVIVTLTEDSSVKKILIDQGIVVHLLNQGSN